MKEKKKIKIKQILNNFKNINFFCRTFSSPNIVLKFIHFLITKRCVKVRESPSCLLITKHCVKVHPWFSRNPIMSTLLLYQNYDWLGGVYGVKQVGMGMGMGSLRPSRLALPFWAWHNISLPPMILTKTAICPTKANVMYSPGSSYFLAAINCCLNP